MTDSSRPNGNDDRTPNSGPGAKKVYRRPEILSIEKMEIVAAVCTYPGKANLAMCSSGPISS
jgi:hypothetical protein